MPTLGRSWRSLIEATASDTLEPGEAGLYDASPGSGSVTGASSSNADDPARTLRFRMGYPRPFLTAVISSPLAVSPLSSQKNAPPRPWFFA